ncbi:hypothetical protein [Labilibacter marinus]|uniref:hypothetical protein n=1 Tax=Labilibacter marinus TaxID=1477105 RepID=UPI00082AECD9|nr:hypothetical protein [Labilibacter marinus]
MSKKPFFKRMLGKDSPLKKILLSKGLPLLANVLTGGAASPIIGLVKNIVGVDSDDPQELEKAINENPEVVARLKEFEMNQKVELEKLALQSAQLELEETKAYLGDRQGARDREVEMMKATGKRDWMLMTLAGVVVVGFFVLIGFAIKDPDGFDTNGPVNQLFGALVAGFSMVLSYFFGSSKGSADKNVTIANQANKANSKEDFSNAKG